MTFEEVFLFRKVCERVRNRRLEKKREINRSAQKKFLFSSSLLFFAGFSIVVLATTSVRKIIYDSSIDSHDVEGDDVFFSRTESL